MKVLHVLDERWDSGITAYGMAVARELKRRGHEVTVAARPGSAAATLAQDAGLPMIPAVSAMGLLSALAGRDFDVVNAHTGSAHTAAFFATRLRRTALVRTRGEARRLSLRLGQEFLFQRTDAVIGASKALAEAYLSRFPFLRGRVSVVYPGVDLPPLVPEPAGPFRAGLLGRLDPVKGHRYFLEAIAQLKDRLKDEEFWVAGDDKNLTREGLSRRAEELGVERWVKFPGRVPDAGAFMERCHAGVIASVGSEAVSRVAMEWLARGRPLVATAVGALPEIVLSGDNGFLLPPKSAGGLARTLRSLIEDAPRRRQMGERARRVAEERFALGRLAEETEKVYAAALDRRRGTT